MINNFLLQNTTCICEQITTVNMHPCHICGRSKPPPEIEKQRQERKAEQDKQRQAFSEKYDPEHNHGKLPF